MREEYDLESLRLKRRGILPGLRSQRPEQAKLRITIALDCDVVEYFKEGGGEARRTAQPAAQALKSVLLQDKDCIRLLARELAHQ